MTNTILIIIVLLAIVAVSIPVNYVDLIKKKRTGRLPLKEGRHHLTVDCQFQSDKYSWCPAGFVPLKITDPTARDLLAQYARRRRYLDPGFCADLLEVLGYVKKVE